MTESIESNKSNSESFTINGHYDSEKNIFEMENMVLSGNTYKFGKEGLEPMPNTNEGETQDSEKTQELFNKISNANIINGINKELTETLLGIQETPLYQASQNLEMNPKDDRNEFFQWQNKIKERMKSEGVLGDKFNKYQNIVNYLSSNKFFYNETYNTEELKAFSKISYEFYTFLKNLEKSGKISDINFEGEDQDEYFKKVYTFFAWYWHGKETGYLSLSNDLDPSTLLVNKKYILESGENIRFVDNIANNFNAKVAPIINEKINKVSETFKNIRLPRFTSSSKGGRLTVRRKNAKRVTKSMRKNPYRKTTRNIKLKNS